LEAGQAQNRGMQAKAEAMKCSWGSTLSRE
jgi:hypothetical protein